MVGPETQGVAHDDGVDPAFVGSSPTAKPYGPAPTTNNDVVSMTSSSVASVTPLHLFGHVIHVGRSCDTRRPVRDRAPSASTVEAVAISVQVWRGVGCKKVYHHPFHRRHALSP